MDQPLLSWWEDCKDWLTPELVLPDWRERIRGVEERETAYMSSLPFVKGVAVIGSVGRGTHWPLSDIDLVIVTDSREEDPRELIRVEEEKRNRALIAAKIPNTVESWLWVVDSEDVARLVEVDDDEFFERIDHWFWRGLVMKAQGGRVAADSDGYLTRILDRFNQILFDDRFLSLWLRASIDETAQKLRDAEDSLLGQDISSASYHLVCAANAMNDGILATWHELPESLTRFVTRFLAFARERGDEEIPEWFLTAGRLGEDETWKRFASAPPVVKWEKEVLIQVRRGGGEDLDELGVTRDLLQAHFWVDFSDVENLSSLPPWTGVTAAETEVQEQLQAAKKMLAYLRSAEGNLTRQPPDAPTQDPTTWT